MNVHSQERIQHWLAERTRRHFFRDCGVGLGTIAFNSLLGQLQARHLPAIDPARPMGARIPPLPARAKNVIFLHMAGAPSQLELFEDKPKLRELHGKTPPKSLMEGKRFAFIKGTPKMLGPMFKYQQHGQSGMWFSENIPHIGGIADEMTMFRTCKTNLFNHAPAKLFMNTGTGIFGRPSMGSWVTYGLGSENQNLPGFIVMCPGGYPIQESQNWQSGFLPGIYQGTHIDTRHTAVEKLIEHIKNRGLSLAEQRRQLDFIQTLNRRHAARRQKDAQLEARIQSFELAYRMQMDATDAFDVNREPKHIRELYGEGTQARQLLIARRLVERGVRFVQVWHGSGQPWDNHDDIEVNHRRLAGQCDQGIGALLKDLKQRGLLDETLVLWGGEFGRTPTVELPTPGSNAGKINGRDHNHHGFTMWRAGGGAKGGSVYGATDEFGYFATKDRVHVHDFNATILHLLGLDHERLTYRHAGRDFRLTDVYGHVVKELLT